jgi:KDZ transposase family protein
MDCPTHRIEIWTGNYFRPAELWEVGHYILINHHSEPHLCPTLKFHKNLLSELQHGNDIKEQVQLSEGLHNRGTNTNCRGTSDFEMNTGTEDHIGPDIGQHDEQESFSQFASRLDHMYSQRYEGDDVGDQDILGEEVGQAEDDIEEFLPLPPDYIPLPQTSTAKGPSAANTDDAGEAALENTDYTKKETPRFDSLRNPYVRVVHTNGVHHIALVYCKCRGLESTHADLMAAGLVPTSFSQYRTIFTHNVLDDFRLSNLECKASAYQYFQKLRRQTSPMSPETVPDLYHELRRMSRLWRWMKKLKWAGVAHRPDASLETNPGELANFCPACPQPGINIPENWWLEQER